MRFLNKKQAGGTQPFRAFPDPSRKNTLIRGYIYIAAARYAEWGAGSEKRVIAVNVPLLKGEVPAAQAVGCWKVVARMRGALWGSFPEFSNHEES